MLRKQFYELEMHICHGSKSSSYGTSWRRLVALSCLLALLMVLFGQHEAALAAIDSVAPIAITTDHGDASGHHDFRVTGHCVSGSQCSYQAVLPAALTNRRPASIPARPTASEAAEGRG
ncbi:MAG: hypothetical protein WD100_12520, partial [Tistlia sp.]